MKGHFAFLAASTLVFFLYCQPVMAVDNLFPSSLFPDEKSNSNSSGKSSDSSDSSNKSSSSQAMPAYKEMLAHADQQMRAEIQKVASWLEEFSLRNQNRFPGVYGSSGTIERAAEVQLTELAGPNPYDAVAQAVQSRELNGLSPGLAYYYNPDGSPVSSSPLANDEWTAELSADNAQRIHLSMDQSASQQELDSFKADPPLNLQASPGTITGSGNGQGFLYVWGAGMDGKPVKDFDGKPYFAVAQTGNTVNDQGQEAGY